MESPLAETSPLNNSQILLLEPDAADARRITAAVIMAELPNVVRMWINPPLSVACFLATMVNVITFSRMNLSQGVTQNLFILSASDSLLGALGVPINVLYVLLRLGHSGGRVRMLYTILWYATNFPINISLLVTTVVALVRCCSVAMPLSFRHVFTTRRQLAAILGSCATVTVILSYFLGNLLTMQFGSGKNATKIFLSKKWIDVRTGLDVCRNALYYSCLIIIVVSMVFLTVALRKSSQFQRETSTALQPASSSKEVSSRSTAAKREARVIKTIILVLAIFVTCNFPFILLSMARLVHSQFIPTGTFGLWRKLVDAAASGSLLLNVGLNLLVYYNYNSHFKQIVRAMFKMSKG